MGIFDNIKASVSSTVRQASDGAKVYADKNRVKKEIMALETELANCYRDLGNMVYREHSGDPDYPYQDLFLTISQVQASLADKQRELNLLLGIQTCPECGATLALNVHYCSNCGAKAPEIAAPVVPQSVCPFCAQPLDPEAMFCSNCGRNVVSGGQQASPFANNHTPVPAITIQADDDAGKQPDKPEDAAAIEEKDADKPETAHDLPEATEQNDAAEKPESPSALICPNCGEPIAPDALFCACCGNMVPGLE